MNHYIRYHSERACVDEISNHGCGSDLYFGFSTSDRPLVYFWVARYDDHIPLPLWKLTCGRTIKPWLWFWSYNCYVEGQGFGLCVLFFAVVESKGKEMIRHTIIVLSLTFQWRHSWGCFWSFTLGLSRWSENGIFFVMAFYTGWLNNVFNMPPCMQF
jgi:hypothetical protein